MGGPKTETKTEHTDTTTKPWAAAEPYFGDLYSAGKQAFARNQALALPQQYLAGPTGKQYEGIGTLYGIAPQLGQGAATLRDMAEKVAGGYFLNPQNDPTFAGAVSAAIDPVTRNLMERILPGITGQHIAGAGAGAGPAAYGGAALALPQAAAIGDWSRAAANTAATMANASRAMGFNMMPQAAGMYGAANQMLQAPGALVGSLGSAEQQLNQIALDDALKRFQMEKEAPWFGIDPLTKLLTSGGYTAGITDKTTKTTTPGPDMGTQILQGLLGAAGIASSMFGMPAAGVPSVATNMLNFFKSFGQPNLVGNAASRQAVYD